jgi:hypothetical protein
MAVARLRGLLETAIDRWFYRVPRRAVEPYATHLPVLIGLARIRRVRTVLELGSGAYSTLAFLDSSLFPHLVSVDSYETDPAWAVEIQSRAAGDSRLDLRVVAGDVASSIAELPLNAYDLILVDDCITAPERCRSIEAIVRKRPRWPTVVVHDFEVREYRVASGGFRYRYRFAALNPNVGILSNDSLHYQPLRALEKLVRASRDSIDVRDRSAWGQIIHAALPARTGVE